MRETLFWLLKVIDDNHVDYDEYDSFVIEAESEDEARALAMAAGGDTFTRWGDKSATTCVPLVTSGVSHVIVGSFNAG